MRAILTLLMTMSFVNMYGAEPSMSLTEAQKYLKAMQVAVVNAAKIASPAVVNISAESKPRRVGFFEWDPFGDDFSGPVRSKGSGVIIDSKGYIVTNNHVVAGADNITVTTSDNKIYTATVIGVDPSADLAVISINADKCSTLNWGDSDKVEVGEYVIAIGNPYGLSNTVTSGIISAKGRQDLGIEGIEDFLQTDAAINPGNSGGALVDIKGNLIGINTAIMSQSGSNSGIGFAIPSNMAKSIVNELIKYGKVQRGWMGIIPVDRRNGDGVVVYRIYRRSPAQTAGLAYGDIILALNNQPVKDSKQLRRMIMTLRPKERITLKVKTETETKTVLVVLGELPLQDDGRLIPGL